MKKLVLILLFCFSFQNFAQTKSAEIEDPPRWKMLGRFAFLFNQSGFSNWKSGGENTVAVDISINYDFNYKKGNLNWDTRIQSNYGLSYIKAQGYRKTNDRFELNSVLGFKLNSYWFFSFFANFRTQFAPGYDYTKTPKVLVSDVLSPAYWTFGPGLLWKKSDNLNINIAPATSRFTFVNDLFSGDYGVPEDKNVNFSLGFNLTGYYKLSIMKNIQMENILTLYSDYLNSPQNVDIDYQSNFWFTVNEFIKMNFTLHTIMDNDASSKAQLRQLFGFGLAFTFHENETY